MLDAPCRERCDRIQYGVTDALAEALQQPRLRWQFGAPTAQRLPHQQLCFDFGVLDACGA
jgi:hypothetical protein